LDEDSDFDFAVLYLEDRHVFYVTPVGLFDSYSSTISLVEIERRQRKPQSTEYRERWDLLSNWATQSVTAEVTPVKVGEPFTGNPEPNLIRIGMGEA